jgi:hypothetical protein
MITAAAAAATTTIIIIPMVDRGIWQYNQQHYHSIKN